MSIPIAEQNIISILGIESLPDERKVAMVEQITTLVQKRLLNRVLDMLSQTERDEFGKLLDEADQQRTNEFLERHVPNMPELLEEEITAVKQELSEWSESLS